MTGALVASIRFSADRSYESVSRMVPVTLPLASHLVAAGPSGEDEKRPPSSPTLNEKDDGYRGSFIRARAGLDR